ncbi:PAS domain-containing protein [Chloroflexota bacterium]
MLHPWETDSDAEKRRVQAAAMEAAANGIVITDNAGTIEWVNLAFSRFTGYTREEIIGKHTRILKSGKQDPAFYKTLWETITAGGVWRGELINRRKDGRTYIEEMTITPVRDELGEISHFISIRQDITGRKDVEAALQKASTELQVKYHDLEIASSQVTAVINAANEAMILLSPDDRFLWLNRAFTLLFSMKPKDIIGHSFSNFAPRFQQVFEDPASIKARLEQAIRDRDLEYKENAVQNWPQKRELEMYSTPVKTALQEYVGTLFVFRDVTHEREVERMKSEFVSLVSHELRTPLTSIKGYVDMLMDGDAGELKQDQVDYLQVVRKNTERLIMLVTNLLDVSKIEAGAVRLNLALLDLAGVISEVVANFRPLSESKKQNFNINLPEKMPPLMGDTGRIAQVLTNLISNACKYTPSGGTISVDVRAEVEFVKISVTDTGVGISPEEQKKLFTKFFRAENPDVQKVGGTGLGLWIARSLVLMHGGEITVASLPGKGSTFSFTLPIDQGS